MTSRWTALAALALVIVLSSCGDSASTPEVIPEETPPAFVIDPAEIPNAAAMQAIADEILQTPTREADATALIEAEGFTARVVERDGEALAATMDYRVDRFNLVVVDDVVTALSVG